MGGRPEPLTLSCLLVGKCLIRIDYSVTVLSPWLTPGKSPDRMIEGMLRNLKAAAERESGPEAARGEEKARDVGGGA